MLLGTTLIFLAALLYSSVGHAGASGYLAVMALLGMAPAEMRPTALLLNLVVATIGSRAFIGAGHFRWSLLWPLVVTSVPMAYLGGRLALPVTVYRGVVGVVPLLILPELDLGLGPGGGRTDDQDDQGADHEAAGGGRHHGSSRCPLN